MIGIIPLLKQNNSTLRSDEPESNATRMKLKHYKFILKVGAPQA